MTLTWSSGDSLDFIEFKRKWEGRNRDRSIDKYLKTLIREKEQSNGTVAKGECEGQGNWYIFAMDEIDGRGTKLM